MFVLAESPAGYGLLKINDQGQFQNVDSVSELFKNSDTSALENVMPLVDFKQFSNLEEAMEASLVGENEKKKLLKPLKKLLKANLAKNAGILLVENPKLGSLISKKFKNITCVADDIALEVVRNIRGKLHEYVTNLDGKEQKLMNRGLAHHFSRFKLQFSSEQEDQMIIHAIKLLEDLDKWLNQLCMRLREWFGINFPELQKIVNDNLLYAKIVQIGKTRTGVLEQDMSDFLEEDIEKEVKDAAKYSMGSKMTQEDIDRVTSLSTLIIDYNEDRGNLNAYLTTRMQTIAPNLTAVVGERVGAKLIAHASSLVNLAKCPASTLQIMGAEKALFRAMKARSPTPKYGHIYHASLVGSSTAKIRGKIARTLACKASLACRIDAFDRSNNDPEVGIRLKRFVERRIDVLTHGKSASYRKPQQEAVASVTKAKQYSGSADVTATVTSGQKRKIVELSSTTTGEPPAKKVKTEKKTKKKKKKKRKLEEAEATPAPVAPASTDTPAPKKKKKKKKKKEKASE